jgi:outer membrane receptor protein involved in Fe transport
VFDDYLRRKSSYIGFNGDITSELSAEHTLKGGIQFTRHTLRYYNHLKPIIIYQGVGTPDSIGPGANDADRYGYDALGNETDDDGRDWRNKTKHPVDLAFYLQDRVEYRGLIITAGLRFDYFDYKGFNLLNPDLPLDPDSLGFDDDVNNDSLASSLEFEDLKEADAFTRLSPRLGIAFPISERTQMRISYGKFFQRPNLKDLYVGYDFMEFQLLGSGYYWQWGNPNLEPPKTTAYEVGVTTLLGDNSSIDVNMFYRDVSDMIQVVNQPSAPNSFGTFRNQDYGTIKGLEFNLKMRRTKYMSLDIKYTLSYATGTGSFNMEGRNSAWVRSDPPKHTSRLEFDQRHKIGAIVDTRFGENQGPRMGDIYPLENFGINFLVQASSGLPYSPVQLYNESSRSSQSPNLIDVRNSQDRPWTMTVDFKAEKALKFGSYKITPYLWVKNLLDHDNEINTWEGTGRANSTGWLNTANGQDFLAQFPLPTDVSGMTVEEKFAASEQPPTYYSNPRQVLFGLRMSF